MRIERVEIEVPIIQEVVREIEKPVIVHNEIIQTVEVVKQVPVYEETIREVECIKEIPITNTVI